MLHIGFFKSFSFNFKFLPFRQAVHLPVLLTRDVQVKYCRRGGVVFDKNITLHPGILRVGFGDMRHNPDNKSSIWIKGKLVIRGNGIHSFGIGTRLIIESKGILEIGNNFTASVNNRIRCDYHITVGNDNMWSYDNVIMDTDGHQITDEQGNVINRPRAVTFGDHVWLGCRNIVLKGSTIPKGCVVASGCVISGEYCDPSSIIASQKRIIKKSISWNRSSV